MRRARCGRGVRSGAMNSSAPIAARARLIRIRWFMAAAWTAIIAKCLFVSWAVDRWQMPFHAAWVVVPTLAFAALATGLWAAHHD